MSADNAFHVLPIPVHQAISYRVKLMRVTDPASRARDGEEFPTLGAAMSHAREQTTRIEESGGAVEHEPILLDPVGLDDVSMALFRDYIRLVGVVDRIAESAGLEAPDGRWDRIAEVEQKIRGTDS